MQPDTEDYQDERWEDEEDDLFDVDDNWFADGMQPQQPLPSRTAALFPEPAAAPDRGLPLSEGEAREASPFSRTVPDIPPDLEEEEEDLSYFDESYGSPEKQRVQESIDFVDDDLSAEAPFDEDDC